MDSIVSSLRLLVRQLASDGGQGPGHRARGGGGRADWGMVVELADHYFLSPALWKSLNQVPPNFAVPEDIAAYLGQVYRLNSERNQGLLGQLEELVFGLNAQGIEPVLLKGASHLVTDVYPDPACRMMGDLDLLVGPGEIDRALEVLEELNYGVKPQDRTRFDDHHHVAPRIREDRLAPVELHRGLILHEVAHLLPTEVAIRNTEAVASNGWSARILSPTYRMIHNMLHSGIVNRYYEESELDLNALYEMYRMMRRYGERIDWAEIAATFAGHQIKGVLDGYLHALKNLFGAAPEGARVGIGAHSFFLRALARVRWRGYDRFEQRLSNLSPRRIRARYGLTADHGPVAINLKRVQLVAEKLRERRAGSA